MTVNNGHDSAWENNITIGVIYPSKKHVKEVVVVGYAEGFQYRCVEFFHVVIVSSVMAIFELAGVKFVLCLLFAVGGSRLILAFCLL
jgi:hypothetical protein